MARKLSPEERETFLARPRVGILSVTAEPGRAPLTTPIWYDYRPGGDLVVLTSPGLRKARLIAAAGRFALCVQDEAVPYTYVSVEGPVVDTRPATEAERRSMAEHYLGAEMAEQYLALTYEAQRGNVAITLRPEQWNATSFDDLGASISGGASSQPDPA